VHLCKDKRNTTKRNHSEDLHQKQRFRKEVKSLGRVDFVCTSSLVLKSLLNSSLLLFGPFLTPSCGEHAITTLPFHSVTIRLHHFFFTFL
jgi:hypothetical protein